MTFFVAFLLVLLILAGLRISVTVWRDDAEPEPVQSTHTVTFVQAECMFSTAATKPRAAMWVHLTCDDATLYDARHGGRRVQVTEPIAQWELVYRDTPFGCMN